MGEWLDRAVIVSPIYYGLCTNEAGYHKLLRGLKVPKDTWPSFVLPNSGATTHYFTTEEGKVSAIVCILVPKGITLIQIHSLLTHEAMHLWREIRQQLREEEPSPEFEAYAIQAISQNLMYSYEKQTTPKKKV